MTLKENIMKLQTYKIFEGEDTLYVERDDVLKLLEQEPCEKVAQERYADLCEYFGGAKDILKNRKDFKAWLERVKWHIHKAEELYEKYEYKKEPCEDAISRQALLDDFGFSEKTRKWGGDHSGYNTMMLYEIQDMIESAPSVNPQPKTGHWITKIKSDLRGDMWPTNPKCSECGGEPYYSNTIYNYKFCPYCGARMVEPQKGVNE